MNSLLDLVYNFDLNTWTEKAEFAFKELFGSENGRYPAKAQDAIWIRAPKFQDGENNVPFATLIERSNPKSGAFGGLCVGIFPVSEHPCLIALGVGTAGLHPDESILARPGHARKAQALCEALNRREGRFAAWAKHDPTRNDLPVPDEVMKSFAAYSTPLKRYSKELHVLYSPSQDRDATKFVLKGFLDLFFEERGFYPLKAHERDAELIREEYSKCLMPAPSLDEVGQLLSERKYMILEGPPGTGKTRLALELLRTTYSNRGASIQFHPNTTYENFIGGLAPATVGSEIGFRFEPVMGQLMVAAARALEKPSEPFLLHIDEINRADLSKVLGEAVMLLEYNDGSRTIHLPYDFGRPFHKEFQLPENLHILGTMNSADRSIAILDVAIRRRFAFIKLWPQFGVVESFKSQLAIEAYRRLLSIFLEYASDEAFALMPGHSYFIAADGSDKTALRSLRLNLVPLLEEYLAQGYVAGFSDHIRAFCQWIQSLKTP